jgi:hypothetical protein
MKKGKKETLRYEPVGVTRWNMCQKLAKAIYHAELSDDEVERLSLEVIEKFELKEN